jgi:protein-export membrane protein SecD
MQNMLKIRMTALLLIILGALTGWFVYSSEINPESNYKFKLGLDLDGGTHLTYLADTSSIPAGDVPGAMDSLRQTVERRINIFGVSEPAVQVERAGFLSGEETANRLIVELPGVTDVSEAIDMIGQTPLLEFKIMTSDPTILSQVTASTTPEEYAALTDQLYTPTGLTGSQLKRATVAFDQQTGTPLVNVEFNKEGTELLTQMTSENVGELMPIFLDGAIISSPVIRDTIYGGVAQISGGFTVEEARLLVQNLNFGALPLPIELAETQSIGASLGAETLYKGVNALVWGFSLIFVFLIVFYRLPGLIATLALGMYLIIMLVLFKFIPVTLTASGLTGFILSLGMAVDANILIFERLKEELEEGSNIYEAIKESSKRAWTSIRDGNLSSLIAAVVLFWMSGTSLIKGFALVFGIGVLVSMFTAIVVSRTFLLVFSSKKMNSKAEFLFGGKLIKNKK